MRLDNLGQLAWQGTILWLLSCLSAGWLSLVWIDLQWKRYVSMNGSACTNRCHETGVERINEPELETGPELALYID